MEQKSTILNELYKTVSKVEMSSIMPGKSFPSRHDHAIVDGNGNILSFCSDNYNLRHNSTLFQPIEELMSEKKLPFDRKVRIHEGTKFYVDYLIRDRIRSTAVNDIIPKISIWNSYDGTLKTGLKFGFYRLVCSNGLTRPVGKTVNIAKKHYKAGKEEDGLDLTLIGASQIMENIQIFLNEANEDVKIYDEMNQKEADVRKILEITEKLKFSKSILETAVNRFNQETATNRSLTYVNEHGELVTHEGSPSTLYTVYNALNYAIYNNNLKEYPEAKLKRDQLVLAEILS